MPGAWLFHRDANNVCTFDTKNVTTRHKTIWKYFRKSIKVWERYDPILFSGFIWSHRFQWGLQLRDSHKSMYASLYLVAKSHVIVGWFRFNSIVQYCWQPGATSPGWAQLSGLLYPVFNNVLELIIFVGVPVKTSGKVSKLYFIMILGFASSILKFTLL